jgi:hypothetical protein
VQQNHPGYGGHEALYRWKLGHHVFHVILIGMNHYIEKCRLALSQGHEEHLLGHLRTLAGLYDAATASMAYAADFASSEYTDYIRPSMMPPFVPPGFSGELNREHNKMIAALTELRTDIRRRYGQHLPSWPDDLRDAWKKVASSQSRNRRNHALVCRKFVPEGGSLLQQFYDSKDSLGV